MGQQLTQLLIDGGYTVRHLNRSKRASSSIDTATWDVNKGRVSAGAFDGVDHIVHLAGAGIADKRWTPERKKLLIDSRANTSKLLFESWKASGQPLKSFVSASAIGIYGMKTTNTVFVESDPASDMYISKICVEWEKAAERFVEAGIRTAIIRIGVVLTPTGGALETMAKPVRFGAGAAIGSGKQWLPWIHVRDLCRQFAMAIEHPSWEGVYNGVAPNPVTNKEFTKMLGRVLKRPVFLPNVPGFLLKLAMGEMAQIALEGSRVSAEKALNAGMKFEFDNAEVALRDLLT